MRKASCFALVLVAAIFARAGRGQVAPVPDPAATVVVSGTVIDKDDGTPVPNARIFVSSFSGAANPGLAGTQTDSTGRFELRVRPGRISITAAAPGYNGPAQGQSLALENGQQRATVDIKLQKLGSVKGVVVDAESGSPIGNVAVYAGARHAYELVTADGPVSPRKPPVARVDGGFSIGNLTDAEFFLRIVTGPEASIETIPAKDLAGDARDKALEAPEGAMGYGDIFWPGGTGDIPDARGLKVTSGTLDVGEVRIEKRKLHTITGVVNGCDPGVSLLMTFAPSGRRDKTLTHDLVCGEGFRILNYPDGSYTLSIVQGGPPRRFAFQTVDSATRGPIVLAVNPTQTVRIDTQLEGVAQDDLPADLQGLRIEVKPETAPVRISLPSKTLEGTFEVELFSGIRYVVTTRVPPKYYLKKLNYNGADLPDVNGFTSYGGALHLVFSDHPGALEVKVDSSASSNYVFAVPEGTDYATVIATGLGSIRQVVNETASTSGTLQLQGLAAGSYRVFLSQAPTPSQDSYEDLLRHATSVRIGEGQTASVTIQAP